MNKTAKDDKIEKEFNEFLLDVNPMFRDSVTSFHNYFLENGCSFAIKPAKSGKVVSYNFIATKRVFINFVFRKVGLITRIYADNCSQYNDLLEKLPIGVKEQIKKSTECKSLNNSGKCSPTCKAGYRFRLNNKEYAKCKFNCFLIPVNLETSPILEEFCKKELEYRTKESHIAAAF